MIFLVGVNSGGLLVIWVRWGFLTFIALMLLWFLRNRNRFRIWVRSVGLLRGWRSMVNINKRGCHGRCCTARTCSLRGCLEDPSTPEIRKGQILIILYLCSYSNWNTAEKKRLMCSGLCCVAQQDRSLWHNKASRSFCFIVSSICHL